MKREKLWFGFADFDQGGSSSMPMGPWASFFLRTCGSRQERDELKEDLGDRETPQELDV